MRLPLLLLFGCVTGALSQGTSKTPSSQNSFDLNQIRAMVEKVYHSLSGSSSSSAKPSSGPAGKNKIPKPPPTKPAEPAPVVPSAKAPTKGTTAGTGAPPAKKPAAEKFCLWEGKKYKASTDINRGQYDTWCYVTYCDANAKVQFWDDYNCPPNSMAPTSTHNTGSGRVRPQEVVGTGSGAAGGAGTGSGAAEGARGAGATSSSSKRGKKRGCFYGGVQYQPGQEISNHRVGKRCYGSYCDFNSKVVNWQDWCINSGPHETTTPTNQDGCYHNKRFFKVGDQVIQGTIGDHCYGYYCDGQNTFVHWEDACATTTSAPTQSPTALWNNAYVWKK